MFGKLTIGPLGPPQAGLPVTGERAPAALQGPGRRYRWILLIALLLSLLFHLSLMVPFWLGWSPFTSLSLPPEAIPIEIVFMEPEPEPEPEAVEVEEASAPPAPEEVAEEVPLEEPLVPQDVAEVPEEAVEELEPEIAEPEIAEPEALEPVPASEEPAPEPVALAQAEEPVESIDAPEAEVAEQELAEPEVVAPEVAEPEVLEPAPILEEPVPEPSELAQVEEVAEIEAPEVEAPIEIPEPLAAAIPEAVEPEGMVAEAELPPVSEAVPAAEAPVPEIPVPAAKPLPPALEPAVVPEVATAAPALPLPDRKPLAAAAALAKPPAPTAEVPEAVAPVEEVPEEAPQDLPALANETAEEPPAQEYLSQDQIPSVSRETFLSRLENLRDEEYQARANPELWEVIRAVRAQMASCWFIDANDPPSPAMTADLRLVLSANGAVTKAQVQEVSRMIHDKAYSRFVRHAKEALESCSPFDLPKEHFAIWKDFTMRFVPKHGGSSGGISIFIGGSSAALPVGEDAAGDDAGGDDDQLH